MEGGAERRSERWHAYLGYLPGPLGLLSAIVLLLAAFTLTGDRKPAELTPAELSIVKQVVAMFPKVASDREAKLSGVYTWRVPSFPACMQHWGLPLSTHNPIAALYLKAIYQSGTEPVAVDTLARTLQSHPSAVDDRELFCDPMTWRFWLNPFTVKLPPAAEIGEGPAAAILKEEILANRRRGYISEGIRNELSLQLASLRAALPEKERQRVESTRLGVDAYAPLAANANATTGEITLSEALVRHVFVRAVSAHADGLRQILASLKQTPDVSLAAEQLKDLAGRTITTIRRDLSFIVAHELAHLFVPTIDEREADCYGLATVIAERGVPEIGVFREIEEALREGQAEYWNGFPAALIEQRFRLIEVWIGAARKGVDIRQVWVRAWASLDSAK